MLEFRVMLTLKVKKLTPDAVMPKVERAGDAGFDLYARESVTVGPGERKQVPIGIALEIPHGYAGLIWDKSGLSHKFGLKTLGGVIDAGYRGEIIVGVINLSEEAYTFEKGHKVAQMVLQKCEQADIVEVDELSDSERGAQGFGSTGK